MVVPHILRVGSISSIALQLILTSRDSENEAILAEFRKVYELRIAQGVKRFLECRSYGSMTLKEYLSLLRLANLCTSEAS